MSLNALWVDPRDHVATALADLAPNQCLELKAGSTHCQVTVREPIPYGHKVALQDLAPGQTVLKYGAPIGSTTVAVPAGSHVHLHNLASRRVAGLA